jgi:hypothetical protein
MGTRRSRVDRSLRQRIVVLEELPHGGPWQPRFRVGAGRARSVAVRAGWRLLGRVPPDAVGCGPDGDASDEGGAGVREPRRPRPGAGGASATLELQ